MASRLKPAVSSKDHILGNKNAPLELVEYGDYQCPHCGRAYPIIKEVQEAIGDSLKFVFRNFPLSDPHPDAFNAAVAAEAAALQHRFWEMHDIIYENQEQLDWRSLLGYAKKIGLDLAAFKTDIEKDSVIGKVEYDFESGIRSGVNGTPSFFINGEKYEGGWGAYDLTAYLRSLLVSFRV
ncbi:MAG: DsbA family protein [Ginsengibacter sp.]